MSILAADAHGLAPFEREPKRDAIRFADGTTLTLAPEEHRSIMEPLRPGERILEKHRRCDGCGKTEEDPSVSFPDPHPTPGEDFCMACWDDCDYGT